MQHSTIHALQSFQNLQHLALSVQLESPDATSNGNTAAAFTFPTLPGLTSLYLNLEASLWRFNYVSGAVPILQLLSTAMQPLRQLQVLKVAVSGCKVPLVDSNAHFRNIARFSV